MTSPQDPPPAWAAPGRSGDPEPPAGPQQPDGPQQPPAGPSPQQPAGWGAPPAPPSWTSPQPQQPAPPPTGWGPQQPPADQPPGWAQQPGWGQQPPPAWGAAPGYGPAPVPGGRPWRPPALQPGIVPLRPLSLGEILDGGVRAIRANPAVMFGLTAVVVTVGVLLSAVVARYLSGLLTGTFSDLMTSLDPTVDLTYTGELDSQFSGLLAQSISAPVTSVATTILTGLLVVSVSRSVLGRKIGVREVARSWRVWWVLGFTILLGLATLLVAALWVGALALLATNDQIGSAVAVGLLGGVGLLVVTLWLTTRTMLVTPALMLEGKGFWRTVGRAWRLTRGSFWRLLGIYVLVNLMMAVLTQVVLVPFSAIGLVVGQSDPFSFGSLAIQSVGQVIALTATTTYTSAVVALLYIDVRMRREGLDVELGRAAAADAAAR